MNASTKKADQLENAIARLQEAVEEYRRTHSQTVRDGAIQRFEFCADLAWKATHDYLQAQGYLDVHGSKPIMRMAYAQGLIDNDQAWIRLLDARNQTSHLYDDLLADAVYQAIESDYLPLLRELSQKLKPEG